MPPTPPLLRGTLLIAKRWELFFVRFEIQPAPRRQAGAGRPRLSPCCHLPAACGHHSGDVPTRVSPHQSSSILLPFNPAAWSLVPSELDSHSHPATFPGNQCHQCQRGYGEENESTSNTQPSRRRRKPPGHPTIVIPRLQISDLTL